MGNKLELLAPAGSMDCLKAALLAGADAVYLAGKRFGARAFASNFDEEGLRWARRVTKALGRKLYITLNTIVFEHEWNLLAQSLDFMEELQPDALIIQDLGIAVELRRRCSRIPLHLSTQGAWYGQGGAEELKELGITRVILPRETSREEITSIVDNNPFEVEVFVHGAMCYSISGRCFWSAALGPRSGNRGTCAQPCRRDYKIENSNYSGCIFSPRDMRLIKEVDALKKTGVSSLKIEGRMKSPEYVYQVVRAYRKALDGKTISLADESALDEVFSRASSTGFFFGPQKPSSWKTGNNPGREGIVVGITTGKFSNNGLAEVVCKNTEILAGDGLFWYEGNEQSGARITWTQKDKSRKNTYWVRGLPKSIGSNIELRRTSKSAEEDWQSLWNKDMERFPIELKWTGYESTPLSVEFELNNNKIRLETDELLAAANSKGLDEGPLQEKFDIIGDDYKTIHHDTDNLAPKLHISGSALKSLKRCLAEKISEVKQNWVCNRFENRKKFELDNSVALKKENEAKVLRVRLWNRDYSFDVQIKADELVLPWQSNKSDMISKAGINKISYWLPPILNSKQFSEIFNELRKLKSGHFICFGWEALKFAKLLPNLTFEVDWCFNVANLSALAYLRNKGIEAVISKEWKDEDIPNDVNAFRAKSAWNPLVSYSRFVDAVKPDQIVKNSHNDSFFTIPVGNGVTGMFIEQRPNSVNDCSHSIQLDLAISPKENPTQVVKQLNRILDSIKKSQTKGS